MSRDSASSEGLTLHGDYTTLSLVEVSGALTEMAEAAETTFGRLDRRQLNWRPDQAAWSVAQCFDHLLVVNRLILSAAEAALGGTRPRSLVQRLPILPGLLGRALIRMQAPGSGRRSQAPANVVPAASDIPEDIVRRFVGQEREAAATVRTLDERRVSRVVMQSPLAALAAYSVLDGLRLIVAHDRRHFEQARRIVASPGFPAGTSGTPSGVRSAAHST